MRIQLNGKNIETDCCRLYQLITEKSDMNAVAIVNGYCIPEDCQIRENDQVFFIPRGRMPDRDNLEAMMASRHTPNVHKKVKESRVAIAGLGGLGSNIAVMLARTGVGTLFLVDYDIVEPSNLNRQNYRISHLGMKKTQALRQQLLEINPFIHIITRDIMVTERNAVGLFQDYPIICEAFDRAETKALLINVILSELPAAYVVSGSGMAGYESSNLMRTSRMMKRLYVCGDFVTEAKMGMGLMAPRVNICAGHQANMVLRLIAGLDEE